MPRFKWRNYLARLTAILFFSLGLSTNAFAQEDWISVGNDRGCMRYSTLDQINTKNVTKLKVAWEYKTGELAEGKAKIMECTPLVIDGVMYVSSGLLKVIALDAETVSYTHLTLPTKA